MSQESVAVPRGTIRNRHILVTILLDDEVAEYPFFHTLNLDIGET